MYFKDSLLSVLPALSLRLTCVLSCSYIRFSAVCANAVRAALKPQFKTEAQKAAEASVKVLKPKAAA